MLGIAHQNSILKFLFSTDEKTIISASFQVPFYSFGKHFVNLYSHIINLGKFNELDILTLELLFYS